MIPFLRHPRVLVAAAIVLIAGGFAQRGLHKSRGFLGGLQLRLQFGLAQPVLLRGSFVGFDIRHRGAQTSLEFFELSLEVHGRQLGCRAKRR